MAPLRLVVAVIMAVHRLLTDHRLQILLSVGERRKGVGGGCEEPHSHRGLQKSRNHASEHEIDYDGRRRNDEEPRGRVTC